MYQTANDDYLLLNTAGASRNERRRGREPHRERMRIGVAGNYYDQGKKVKKGPQETHLKAKKKEERTCSKKENPRL